MGLLWFRGCKGQGGWLRAGCSRFRDLGVLGFVSWFKVLGGSGFRFKGVQGLGLRVWDRLGLGGVLGFRWKFRV